MKRNFILSVIASILVLFTAQTFVVAVDYPTKPITLINPSAPGGQLGVGGQLFASVAEKYLGQPIVMISKPGAGNMVGGLAGAQAAPDGYTLTIIATGFTNGIEWEIANGRKPPFTRHDYATIGAYNFGSPLVVVPFDSPWKTLADLINDCKAKPNYYAFSSGGLFGGSHLPAEVLMKATGIKARHVPYKGGGPALTALVGKHVDFATQYPSRSIPLAKGNKLRILAIQSDQRLKVLPEVPTVKELGVDAVYLNWIGLGVPKKTPVEILEKLRDVLAKVVKDKAFVEPIEKLGDEVRYMDGETLAKHWDEESERTGKLLAELVKEASKK